MRKFIETMVVELRHQWKCEWINHD